MADEEIKIETEAPAPDALPVMPDMIVGGETVNKYDIKVRLWILITAIILLIIPYFFFYRYGYQKGYSEIFSKNENILQKKTEYNDPSFNISEITVNLMDTDSLKYLELSLRVTVREDNELSECVAREIELKDALITSISAFKSTDIDSVPEQSKLKRLMRDVMNATLQNSRVVDIYFNKYRIKLIKPENYINIE